MTTSLVTFEQKVVVKDTSPQEIIDLYDGLVPGDGLIIKNVRGKILVCECVESEIKKLIEFTKDDEEVVVCNQEADIAYQLSTSKEFGIDDMIRIEGMGDFNIIQSSIYSFLFGGKKEEKKRTIEMNNARDISSVKLYLDEHYPNFKVLRKTM